MDDLKIPVILLLCILGGVGFYFYNKSQNPTKPTVKPKIKVEKKLSEEEINEQKKQQEAAAENELIKKTKQAFENGDFEKTLDSLSEHKNSSNYEIQRMIAYSLSSKKEFDQAILAFEKVLKIRKVPADGYSLAYLYEVTGRFEAAASIYLELVNLELPPKLKRNVYEGIARISEYLPDNKELYKYLVDLTDESPDSKDGIMSLIKYKMKNFSYDGIETLAEKGNKHFSQDYQYNYELAQLFDSANDYDNALTYYKKCLKLDPQNYTPYLDCYNVLEKDNKPEKAIKALEGFLDGGQPYPNLFFEASLKAHKYKMFRQAFRLYMTSVVSDTKLLGKEDEGLVSDTEKYYKEKGNKTEKVFYDAFVSYLNGDYNQTISEIKEIEDELNNSAYKEDYKLLLEACDVLLKKDKKRDEEINAYENFLRAQEEAEKARKEAAEQRAAESKRKDTTDYRTYTDKDLKMLAIKNFSKYDIQLDVAKEFYNRGKLADAEQFYTNASNAKPNSFEPYYQLARISSMQNDFEKSQNYIEEAIKRNPSDVNSLAFASSICLKNNDTAKSKEYASLALQNSPNNSLAKISLAKVLIIEQSYEDANTLIDSALAEEKSNVIRYELENLKKQIKENTQK